MTPASRSRTASLFRQAQIHLGIGRDATPADVALATIRQAARSVQACLAQDPSLSLTLPVPHGLLGMLEQVLEEDRNG